jgi:serine phosphatase RsbU (regulator of sigma subunit)
MDLLQSICVDSKGVICIGTFGGGLDRFDPRSGTFTHLTEENSDVPNNVIYGVLCDRADNVWLSSNRGIARYNPVTKVVTTFDTHDGLQSMEFNGQACFRSETGEMFFGGINGFNAFYPDSIEANPVPPMVAITEFRLFNKPVRIGSDSPLRQHILETKDITLAHWQNDLSFTFVALHFNRPERNRYAYMLEHYDQGWRDAGASRLATYTNLDPGTYVFRVRASNDAGIWNVTGASIRIVILPPWWQTGAAKAAYIFFTIVFLYLGYVIQHRVVTRQERARARYQEMELRAEMAETQARAIQAENDRKTHELEEARKLQLSMLPKELPDIPGLQIAVHMQTATEVGGDYYDFHIDELGALTVVVGDATGHGLSAGTMVSVIKSLFISNNGRLDMKDFFQSCTRTIKQLRLGNLYMALMLARIENGVLTASAAGMPPIYIYRASRKAVDVVTMKGMPLGAFNEFVYEDSRITLESGDTVLLLSDGLPELFNDQREMFDYHRVSDTFARCAAQPAQAVVDCLIRAADDWRQGKLPNDDITFVVVKVV